MRCNMGLSVMLYFRRTPTPCRSFVVAREPQPRRRVCPLRNRRRGQMLLPVQTLRRGQTSIQTRRGLTPQGQCGSAECGVTGPAVTGPAVTGSAVSLVGPCSEQPASRPWARQVRRKKKHTPPIGSAERLRRTSMQASAMWRPRWRKLLRR